MEKIAQVLMGLIFSSLIMFAWSAVVECLLLGTIDIKTLAWITLRCVSVASVSLVLVAGVSK